MMTVKQVLISTRALLASPENWMQGSAVERTAGGKRYCIYGALSFATPVREDSVLERPLFLAAQSLLRRVLGRDDVSVWNDLPDTTHDDVLFLLDGAIALAG